MNLSVLNACFNEKFETMAQYKEEETFKKVLDKLTLNDVYYAIQNAEKITKYNQENQIKVHFAKYTYYRNIYFYALYKKHHIFYAKSSITQNHNCNILKDT